MVDPREASRYSGEQLEAVFLAQIVTGRGGGRGPEWDCTLVERTWLIPGNTCEG